MPTHKVRFQPVNIEIDVDEDETVLNAAFRQGISLTHGCREGQCSACKSFLLDGDIEMDKYSTFALPEYESDEGLFRTRYENAGASAAYPEGESI